MQTHAFTVNTIITSIKVLNFEKLSTNSYEFFLVTGFLNSNKVFDFGADAVMIQIQPFLNSILPLHERHVSQFLTWETVRILHTAF